MGPVIQILHLEDDPVDAELVQAKIVEAGLVCRITCVQTRDAFDAALGQDEVDIILADYRLPAYDGMAALRLAHERCPETPFIFVSGTMGEEAAIEALTQGATDYVLKQNLSRLAPAVKRALEETRNRRERRQAQAALQRSNLINAARIHLMQFAVSHSLDELLEETVNEAENVTDSRIGFYHFVDDDQQSLTLQNWSTRTKTRFCKARGKGLHYPIAEAGVWVDCVRQRQPVIHNDYLSLTHRKGLPEGHAEVIRELVVPVLRGEKIKAILGVGNKPSDYTEKDVAAMSLLADLVWEITERKQAEAALAAREHEFRTLAENLPDNIVRYDREGRTVYLNPVLEKNLGADAAQMIGTRVREFHADGSYEAYAQAVDAVLTSGKNGEIEFIVPVPSREPIVHQIRLIPERDQHGELTGVLAICRDITEHKLAQLRLNEQLHFLQQLLDSIPIPVYYKDPQGLYLGCNAAFEAFTGLARKDIVGKTVHETVPKERADKHHAADLALLRHPGLQTYEVSGIFKDGNHHDVIFNKATFVDANGCVAGTVGALMDITSLKKAEEERKLLQAKLHQTQKMEAVGQLAGGVAHDFNNMLGVIIGHAELALGMADLDDPLRRHLQEILAAGLRSAEITRQLLAFARKQTIAPKILDLNETVEGMLKLLRRLIGEDIDLAWLPGSTLWPVKMDPSQIDQILANLCVNARDAIDGVGKITIETHKVDFDSAYCAEHKGFNPGAYVMLAVSDNGSGMDKPTMDKIFEPFFTTKGMGKGTGLGLATVYGIVKQNQGFINVYSEPEHGSTFKIYLPRHEGLAGQEVKAASEHKDLTGHETILVVEDEIEHLRMVELILEKYGYHVLSAPSPGEALLAAKAHPDRIHLLLTDLIMPEMNGRDLSNAMTALYPDMICLFMSGYTNNVIVHHNVLDEGVYFIQKPFSMQNLAVKVRKVLDADQARQSTGNSHFFTVAPTTRSGK
jgi:two-component system, cell cycle sensor histidine kinase and response regulator CckA